MENSHEYYTVSQPFVSKMTWVIDYLKKISMNSDVGQRHSAALFKKNKIFSFGYNKSIKHISTNTTKQNYDDSFKITIHAEINALYQANKKCDLRGVDILIIRTKLTYSGKIVLRNSRPCSDCIDKMMEIGIRKVYYSNASGDIVYEFLDTMLKSHTSAGRKNIRKFR